MPHSFGLAPHRSKELYKFLYDLLVNSLLVILFHKKLELTCLPISSAIVWTQLLLATVVKSDPKAPFSVATTPTCREGRYPFPWIASIYPWYVSFNAECKARRYQVPFLETLVWLELGLTPSLPGHWTSSRYCYLTLINLFNIIPWFASSEIVLCIIIQH